MYYYLPYNMYKKGQNQFIIFIVQSLVNCDECLVLHGVNLEIYVIQFKQMPLCQKS